MLLAIRQISLSVWKYSMWSLDSDELFNLTASYYDNSLLFILRDSFGSCARAYPITFCCFELYRHLIFRYIWQYIAQRQRGRVVQLF